MHWISIVWRSSKFYNSRFRSKQPTRVGEVRQWIRIFSAGARPGMHRFDNLLQFILASAKPILFAANKKLRRELDYRSTIVIQMLRLHLTIIPNMYYLRWATTLLKCYYVLSWSKTNNWNWRTKGKLRQKLCTMFKCVFGYLFFTGDSSIIYLILTSENRCFSCSTHSFFNFIAVIWFLNI